MPLGIASTAGPWPVVFAGITEMLGWEWSGPDLPELTFWQWVAVFLASTVVSVVLSLAAVRWVLSTLPADYFTRPVASLKRRTVLGWLSGNLIGLIVLSIGLVLLVTPGQGILLILTGLVMTDFPGKHRLERRLAARPTVLRGLNWVRGRLDRPPFEPPAASS